MDEIAQRLRESGLKVTPQRLTIYKMLLNTRSHPGAEEVYREVKELLPGLSFNTVYTTLMSLQEKGLIQKLDVGQGRDRFDANPKPHIHLVCLNCGKVEDFGDEPPDEIKDLFSRVKGSVPWEVLGLSIAIFGYCPRCSAKEEASPPSD